MASMDAFRFSRRVQGTPPALSIYMNEIVYAQKRRGIDITTLSLGEAFFDIPMFDFAKIDFVRGYHYSDSQGLPELRSKISEFYRKQYSVVVDDVQEILITAGSKAAIYLAAMATLDRDDEVLIHEPAWLSYQEHVRLLDATPRFIPFDAAPSDFGKWLGNRTRMLVINNPNNPAGRVYSPDELATLVNLCRSNGLWLLVDEAYSDFLQPGLFHSALEFDPHRDTVIVINSLSKNMGMSGWRIGYIMSNASLIREVLKLNQHIITCAPTVLQSYLAHYFENIINVTLPQAREIAEKRDRIAVRLDNMGLNYLPGAATFYFFVSIDEFPSSSMDLAIYLLLVHNISVVPGSAYGASTERFVRISIGTESEERIEDALMVIRNVLRTKPDTRELVEQRLSALGIRPFKS